MIKGFDKETEPLNDEEKALLPKFVRGLVKRVGKKNAITNGEIREAFKNNLGIEIPPARVRKIINHIRIYGLVELLCASSKGYYVAEIDKEIVDYMEGLNSRIEAQNLVLNKLAKQYSQLRLKLK
tara:strand:- start:1408 stop:1782 length:375 start_codon:yes stop_codon:yes gene_type:complete